VARIPKRTRYRAGKVVFSSLICPARKTFIVTTSPVFKLLKYSKIFGIAVPPGATVRASRCNPIKFEHRAEGAD
jgi:hypothetical protein